MISKLNKIFFKPDVQMISEENDWAYNASLLDRKLKGNKSYFVDCTTGYAFYNSSKYSKYERRVPFLIVLLLLPIYPFLCIDGLRGIYDCAWVDVLRIFIMYAPLCAGMAFIACFGLFCPLRAVTMVQKMESLLIGKSCLICMTPLYFPYKKDLFSPKAARIAKLRQGIVAKVLAMITLCAVRFLPAFQQFLVYAGVPHMLVILPSIAIAIAVLALLLSVVVDIQASNMTAKQGGKVDNMLSKYMALYLSVLAIAYCCVTVFGGIAFLSPVLLSIIAVVDIGAAFLLYYCFSKDEAKDLASIIFAGQSTCVNLNISETEEEYTPIPADTVRKLRKFGTEGLPEEDDKSAPEGSKCFGFSCFS